MKKIAALCLIAAMGLQLTACAGQRMAYFKQL